MLLLLIYYAIIITLLLMLLLFATALIFVLDDLFFTFKSRSPFSRWPEIGIQYYFKWWAKYIPDENLNIYGSQRAYKHIWVDALIT